MVFPERSTRGCGFRLSLRSLERDRNIKLIGSTLYDDVNRLTDLALIQGLEKTPTQSRRKSGTMSRRHVALPNKVYLRTYSVQVC
eukprot:scaffold7637_cov430-Prasinococcus_capsulatus_cf.AAC.5